MADDLKLKLEIDSILNSIGLDEAKAKVAALEAQASTAAPEVEALGAATVGLSGPLLAATAAITFLLPQLLSWVRQNEDTTESVDKLNVRVDVTLKKLQDLIDKVPGAVASLGDLERALTFEKQRTQRDALEDLRKQIAQIDEQLKRARVTATGFFDIEGTKLTATPEAIDKARIAIEKLTAEREALVSKARYFEEAILDGSTAAERAESASKALAEQEKRTKEAAEDAARQRQKDAKQEEADIKRGMDFARDQELDFTGVLDREGKKQHAEYLKRIKDQTEYQLAVKRLKENELKVERQLAEEKRALDMEVAASAAQGFLALVSLFGKNKTRAIGEAIISANVAAAQALAEIPWPANVVVAASLYAEGLARANEIRKTTAYGFDDPFADLTARRLGRKSAVDFVSNFGSEFIPGVSAGMQTISNTTINRGTTVNMGGIHGALGPRPAFDKWLERAMSKATRMRSRTTIGR